MNARSDADASPGSPWTGWVVLAVLLVIGALGLRLFAPSFRLEVEYQDLPVLPLVASLCALTLASVVAIPKLAGRERQPPAKGLVMFIVAVGLVMRILQFGVEPILEDDYNRYLWDGAVTAAGQSPYRLSPQDVLDGAPGSEHLQTLRTEAQATLEKINYPQYRTVYPPVAQAGFALAHTLAPYSLDAWRTVLLAVELGCLLVLALVLVAVARPVAWISLYWWNPVVVKEVAHSGHMEPLVMLPVLIGAWLVIRMRPVAGSALFGIAAATKLWPALLATVPIRTVLRRPASALAAMSVMAAIIGLSAWPVVAAGLDASSGFVAYAQKWQASSASYLMAEWAASLFVSGETTGLIARGILACLLLVFVAVTIRRTGECAMDLLQQMFLIAAAVYLLSPSQFPWYFVWVAPFLCVFPVRGLLLAGVLIPFHYFYFYFDARDMKTVYIHGVVWLIWLPVWGLLAFDYLRKRT